MKQLLKQIYTEIKNNPTGTKAYEDLYYMSKEAMKTSEALGVKYLKLLSEMIEKRIPKTKSDKDLRFLFGLHRRVLLAAAPYDFDCYLLYVEWNREPDKKFYPPRRKVLKQVVDALQELADDKLDLLAVSLPPGSGKTTLAIFYLTWLAGRIPNEPMLTGSHSNEIVSFKVGYLCGEPIQYVSRNGSEETVKAINALNEFMFAEDKASQDQELVEWQMICGTSYRLVLPDKSGEQDEAPFELYTLDPRDTFIVYSNEIGNKPIMAVKYSTDDNEQTHYSIYTEDSYFLIDEGVINEEKSKPHILGMIPIFEYPANNAKLGAFEVVLPLLDAINNMDSNRMDGIEQLIQAFIKFINCEISKEEYEEFLKLGAIKVKSVDGQNADVGVVTSELNQTQSQTLKDDIYNAVLTICGMPNRNGNASTSDTGSAVIMRDGWSDAEARANAITNGYASAGAWCDSEVDLMRVFRQC